MKRKGSGRMLIRNMFSRVFGTNAEGGGHVQ
jgi:hypothetical protein